MWRLVSPFNYSGEYTLVNVFKIWSLLSDYRCYFMTVVAREEYGIEIINIINLGKLEGKIDSSPLPLMCGSAISLKPQWKI